MPSIKRTVSKISKDANSNVALAGASNIKQSYKQAKFRSNTNNEQLLKNPDKKYGDDNYINDVKPLPSSITTNEEKEAEGTASDIECDRYDGDDLKEKQNEDYNDDNDSDRKLTSSTKRQQKKHPFLTPSRHLKAPILTPVSMVKGISNDLSTKITAWLNDRETTIQALRAFDLNGNFGPCIGLSRLERWKRAKKFGMDPPEIIGKFLECDSLTKDVELFESLWYPRKERNQSKS